ncbi:hypothetical protein BC827DRAFT_183492 [Russula dissimulans]|nr:hypothetical protein BC827DRAFT_183492 [Russula dissimulans]
MAFRLAMDLIKCRGVTHSTLSVGTRVSIKLYCIAPSRLCLFSPTAYSCCCAMSSSPQSGTQDTAGVPQSGSTPTLACVSRLSYTATNSLNSVLSHPLLSTPLPFAPKGLLPNLLLASPKANGMHSTLLRISFYFFIAFPVYAYC